MTIAHDLWKQFGALTLADIPVQAETVATQCILDWFACTIAGRTGAIWMIVARTNHVTTLAAAAPAIPHSTKRPGRDAREPAR